ncbi:MAG: hypothetical protein ABMA26_11350 [Limisphaerales bacterium]
MKSCKKTVGHSAGAHLRQANQPAADGYLPGGVHDAERCKDLP